MTEPEIAYSDDNGSIAYWPASIATIRRTSDDSNYTGRSQDCVVAPERALNNRGWSGHDKNDRNWGPEGADKWYGWFGDAGTMPLSEAPSEIQTRFWERLNTRVNLDI